jgi:hypothetical protein
MGEYVARREETKNAYVVLILKSIGKRENI